MIPLCREDNIAIIPWSPLARGFLVGNRKAPNKGATTRSKTDDFAGKLYYQPEDFAIVEQVTALAGARGVNNAQIALAWVLAQPGITAPIVGATRMPHLDDALAALALELTPAEMKALEAPYKPHSVLGITF